MKSLVGRRFPRRTWCPARWTTSRTRGRAGSTGPSRPRKADEWSRRLQSSRLGAQRGGNRLPSRLRCWSAPRPSHWQCPGRAQRRPGWWWRATGRRSRAGRPPLDTVGSGSDCPLNRGTGWWLGSPAALYSPNWSSRAVWAQRIPSSARWVERTWRGLAGRWWRNWSSAWWCGTTIERRWGTRPLCAGRCCGPAATSWRDRVPSAWWWCTARLTPGWSWNWNSSTSL